MYAQNIPMIEKKLPMRKVKELSSRPPCINTKVCTEYAQPIPPIIAVTPSNDACSKYRIVNPPTSPITTMTVHAIEERSDVVVTGTSPGSRSGKTSKMKWAPEPKEIDPKLNNPNRISPLAKNAATQPATVDKANFI